MRWENLLGKEIEVVVNSITAASWKLIYNHSSFHFFFWLDSLAHLFPVKGQQFLQDIIYLMDPSFSSKKDKPW